MFVTEEVASEAAHRSYLELLECFFSTVWDKCVLLLPWLWN